MRGSKLFTAAAFAVCAITPAAAAVAPFGCDAGAGATCYFRIYYAPGVARLVQLAAGTKTSVPDVNIGSAHYCMTVDKAPPPKCSLKRINANYNN